MILTSAVRGVHANASPCRARPCFRAFLGVAVTTSAPSRLPPGEDQQERWCHEEGVVLLETGLGG